VFLKYYNGNVLQWKSQFCSHFAGRRDMAMYHEITGKGYNIILEKTTELGFKLAPKSFQFNCKKIREVLACWGKEQVDLGTLEQWKAAMRGVAGTKLFKNVCLWIDSTDFKMQNVKGKKKTGKDWSYKCNSKGRRYMILRDGKGRIRKMWGGYSPKVFDGHFLMILKEWFEENLKGAGVIGDQHFEMGKKLEGVKFYTKHRKGMQNDESETEDEDENTDTESEDDAVNLSVNTKKEKVYNSALYKLRARVEIPFGEINTIFKVLAQHWAESEEQLDNMVWIAVGVLNHRKK